MIIEIIDNNGYKYLVTVMPEKTRKPVAKIVKEHFSRIVIDTSKIIDAGPHEENTFVRLDRILAEGQLKKTHKSVKPKIEIFPDLTAGLIPPTAPDVIAEDALMGITENTAITAISEPIPETMADTVTAKTKKLTSKKKA